MQLLKLLPLATLAAIALSSSASAAPGNKVLDRRFAKADLNNDGWIDATEILSLQKRSKSWVDTMYRFQLADVDDNGLLSITEFRASKGVKEGGRLNGIQKFVLADIDKDGFLDPEEYARTLPQNRPWKKVLRDFGRKDKNDDSLVSPQEFGIRGWVL
ncbi:hypothetical protein OKA04_19015 [Luteolibacter flavescens]|uniref:EF-hand domain-containing protein n=1 Tax=Luteolibacter flavescens TaxID=1859460 RepID=A0ABT3FTD4_9BACT|nr:hypothetical protein [Luteolibacter flavescens]MCW1886839.1 hypothetical protein [Luteolibacter flavescens]